MESWQDENTCVGSGVASSAKAVVLVAMHNLRICTTRGCGTYKLLLHPWGSQLLRTWRVLCRVHVDARAYVRVHRVMQMQLTRATPARHASRARRALARGPSQWRALCAFPASGAAQPPRMLVDPAPRLPLSPAARMRVTARARIHLQLVAATHIADTGAARAVQSNDMMMAVYLSSMTRAVVSLHNLIENKEARVWHEKKQVAAADAATKKEADAAAAAATAAAEESKENSATQKKA